MEYLKGSGLVWRILEKSNHHLSACGHAQAGGTDGMRNESQKRLTTEHTEHTEKRQEKNQVDVLGF